MLILFGIGEAFDFQPGSRENVKFYKVVNVVIPCWKKSSHQQRMAFQRRSARLEPSDQAVPC